MIIQSGQQSELETDNTFPTSMTEAPNKASAGFSSRSTSGRSLVSYLVCSTKSLISLSDMNVALGTLLR